MKKILLIIFIFINIFFINYQIEDTNKVSLVVNDNSYNLYKLYTNLTTKNILNYVNSEIKIITIYPKINSKIENYSYSFTNSSNENNIALFTNEYRNLLKKYNYIKEANLISFNGIKINKIIISTNEKNLYILLKTNKFVLE